MIILNQGEQDVSSLAAEDVVTKLSDIVKQMKSDFMKEDGSGVDYVALQSSQLFKQYSVLTNQLRQLELQRLSPSGLKALAINLYNCLMIHILIHIKLPDKPIEMEGVFTNYGYNIGGYEFSLDDLEHGILRGNRPHPSTKAPLFKPGDPRIGLALQEVDCRIHFALNCGAKSCPPIRVYDQDKLDKQLDIAAKGFCSQEVKVEDGVVWLSQIFEWYGSDFGKDDVAIKRKLLDFVTDKDIQAKLNDDKVPIKFVDYDWKINVA